MGIKFVKSLQDAQNSEHGRSTLPQPTKEVFWRYPSHVACLVEIGRWCWGIAFVLTSVTFDENPSDDKKENGTQSTGESNQYDEPDGQMTP